MVITLSVVTDLYSKPDKNGIQKVSKRNVIFKKQFETNDIKAEQYLNTKGIPSKKWCTIKSEGEYFKLNHKFEDIKRLTEPVKVKGFM